MTATVTATVPAEARPASSKHAYRVGFAASTGASLRAELLKMGKRPATWLIGGVWLLLGLMFGYVFPYLSYRGTSVGGPEDTIPAEQILAGVLPSSLAVTPIQGALFAGALALIFGVMSTGSEYGWLTVKTILTQRPSRLAVLSGKFAALAIAILAIVTAAFAVNAVASAVIATTESRPLIWPSGAELAQGFGAALLIFGMWCALGALAGIALRGTPLGIGLGLVWALVVENLIRGFASLLGFIDALQKLLPGTNAGALAAALGARTQGEEGTPGVTDVVSGQHAVIVLTVYLIAAVIAAGVLFRRRDVV